MQNPNVPKNVEMYSPVIIHITGKDTESGDLFLDNNPAHAVRGNQVLWINDPNETGIDILSIERKPNSANVFDPIPSRIGSSPNWGGVIKINLVTPDEETYNIHWRDLSTGQQYKYDPVIKVNN